MSYPGSASTGRREGSRRDVPSESRLHRHAGTVDRVPGGRARVFAFHGGKGGAGATMLAAECAAVLGSRGSNVVAIDADLHRGSLGYYLDVPASADSYSLLDLVPVMDELTPRVLENALAVSPSGARLLAAPASERPPSIEASCASKVLGSLAERFGTVLVDTPPALDPLTVEFLLGADRTVFVVTPEVICLGPSRAALAGMSAAGLPLESVDLVVNRWTGGADGIPTLEIERYLGVPVALVLPEDTRRCRRLGNAGLPITSERSKLGSGLTALVHLLSAPAWPRDAFI